MEQYSRSKEGYIPLSPSSVVSLLRLLVFFFMSVNAPSEHHGRMGF